MVTPVNFNPFTDKLGDNQRLRLVDGQLTVENTDVRATQMSGWERFWTRGQYSQSAILKEMGHLFKTVKKGQAADKTDHINNTFLENYKTLESRAEQQNKDFAEMNCVARFFEAKSEINVAPALKKIDEIKAIIETKEALEAQEALEAKALEAQEAQEAQKAALYATGWWQADASEDFPVPPTELTVELLSFLDERYAYNPLEILTDINVKLSVISDKPNISLLLGNILKAIGLETVSDFVEKGIYTKEDFQYYIIANSQELTQKLLDTELFELNN